MNMQVGGTHYVADYQHWDYVVDSGMGYLDGNATKYICRYHLKGGKQDLEKAIHYINKMIELVLAGKLRPSINRPDPLILSRHFYKIQRNYSLNHYQTLSVRALSIWKDAVDLRGVRAMVVTLLETCP